MNINHNDAIELESIIRYLYDCDRSGVAGLADADIFDDNPLYAAVMVISYYYANKVNVDGRQLDEFLFKYSNAFSYPNEVNVEEEVKHYIKDLRTIVNKYGR